MPLFYVLMLVINIMTLYGSTKSRSIVGIILSIVGIILSVDFGLSEGKIEKGDDDNG